MKKQMGRKMKRTTRQYIIVAFICIIVIGAAAVVTTFFLTAQIRQKNQAVVNNIISEMEANKRQVFVAITEIANGDYITSENVQQQNVYSSQPQETYITSEDIGKIAVVAIPIGTHVIHTMLTDNLVSSELRELEYDVIFVSSNIVSTDTVDVRIQYPNGESYVVLPKKVIKGVNPDSTACYFWINEEELLRMSAAICK